jgi:hypothetical protein
MPLPRTSQSVARITGKAYIRAELIRGRSERKFGFQNDSLLRF